MGLSLYLWFAKLDVFLDLYNCGFRNNTAIEQSDFKDRIKSGLGLDESKTSIDINLSFQILGVSLV